MKDGADQFKTETFYASKKSQQGKSQRYLWLGGVIGLAISAISAKGSMTSFIVLLVIVLLIYVPVYWILQRQLKLGKALIVVSPDAIESSIFTGKIKHYQWCEIASVSHASIRGIPYAQLQLEISTERPDKRRFWTGHNAARPGFPLAAFEPDVQERILGVLIERVHHHQLPDGAALQTLVNPLVEEREFQEKLKSFAPIPWVTYLFIGINVLVWGLMLVNGISALQTPADVLFHWGGNAASEVQRGAWWRLLTATFLHSGFIHLFMNMLGLYSLGLVVERIYGHRLFALIYLGSGLLGSALSLHFAAQHAVSVGASGAVFGVAGALLVGLLLHKNELPKVFGKQILSGIGFFIAYSLLQGFTRQGIDNAAHIGGMFGGGLLAYLLPMRFDMERFVRNFRSRLVAGVAAVVATTAVLASSAPSASLDQKSFFENGAAFTKGMRDFQTAINALAAEQAQVKAGKLTERASDERSRTVFAPMFKKLDREMSQVSFPDSDPRAPLFKDTQRITALILESLEMQSIYKPGSDKPEPANPARSAAIDAEVKQLGAHVRTLLQRK